MKDLGICQASYSREFRRMTRIVQQCQACSFCNFSVATMQETTEKMVRKQLQSSLGVDLSDRKAFIKEQVRTLCNLCNLHQEGLLRSSFVASFSGEISTDKSV